MASLLKKFWWLLLLLLLLVLFLYFRGCMRKPAETGTLEIGPMGYSIWPDGSIALAIPLVDAGAHPINVVNVAEVTLGAGSLLLPTALPIDLGEILAGKRAVLQTRFNGVTVPGSPILTVSGTYTESGTSHAFTATAVLKVAAPHSGTNPTATTSVPKQVTSGVPTAPSHVPQQLDENDELGPAVPIGPTIHPFPIAPTQTGPKKAGPPGTPGQSVTILTDTGTNQSTGWPPDPSTAASASGVVLDPNNTYMLFSVNSGSSFTQIDPTTIFPQSDGGLCCDQVVVYDSNTDLFFWMMQYRSNSAGQNRLRIAYQHPANLKTNFNAWTYFDLTVATFNGSVALDYPDISVTNQFLYASVDGSDSSGKNVGVLVARMPLSDITGGGSSIGIGYISTNQLTDLDNAWGSRLTQQSADGMYWAGHVDTSHLEVYHWPDSSSDVTSNVTSNNTWCNADYTSLAPDNQQWIDASRAAGSGRVIAGARQATVNQKAGTVWLGWGAAKDDSSCKNGRPQPYVDIAQIDANTLNTVGEYDIWNTPYAFAYPSLGASPNGDMAVTVSFGGPTDYGSSSVGYLGDYVVYYVDESTVTLTFPVGTDSKGQPVLGTRYGDMFAVRPSGTRNVNFSSELYAYKYVNTSTPTCSSAAGCTFYTHYVQFGR